MAADALALFQILQKGPAFKISQEDTESIYSQIKAAGAIDVNIGAYEPEGDTVMLIAQVPDGAPEDAARRLGESLLRKVMTLSNDTNPKQEIGKSHFSYHIALFTSGWKKLAYGSKPDSASKIT